MTALLGAPFILALLVLGTIFMLFVAPIWIFFSFLTSNKTNKSLTREDEKMLQDLWQMAHKMDDRIANLETILKE